MTRHISRRLLAAASLVLLAAGCDKEPASPDAYIAVYLEDAPADYRSVNISIERVELYGQSGWVEMPLLQKSIELLSLTGGVSATLAEGHFTPGEYTKLRVVFAESGNSLDITPTDNTEEETGDETGLTFDLTLQEEHRTKELPIDIKAPAGSRNLLMLDMDAAASVVHSGGEYLLRPALSIMNLDYCGAISGAIADQEGKAISERMLVETVSSAGIVKHTYTNTESGKFFVRLSPGTYTLHIYPQANSPYLEYSAGDITVSEARATMLGPVTPEPAPTEQ